MKRYKELILYSEMEDTLIVLEGLKTLRGFKMPSINDTPQKRKELIDKTRTQLATLQHEKIHSVESFNELTKCQLIMFK